MPLKKPARESAISPFVTADRLLDEGRKMSENERRLKAWAEAMVRERKLDPSWEDDRDAASTVRWISDRLAAPPAEKPKKAPGRRT